MYTTNNELIYLMYWQVQEKTFLNIFWWEVYAF